MYTALSALVSLPVLVCRESLFQDWVRAASMALIPGSSVTITPVTGGLGPFTTPHGTLAGGEIAGPSSAFPAGPAMTAPLAVSGVAPSPTISSGSSGDGPGPTTSTSASGGLPATTGVSVPSSVPVVSINAPLAGVSVLWKRSSNKLSKRP